MIQRHLEQRADAAQTSVGPWTYRWGRWFCVVISLSLSWACSSKPAPTKAEPQIPAQVGGQAAEIYRSRCATCHGIAGHGDGITAGSLPVKPRSLREQGWLASVSDEHLKAVIVHGGTAVGKSALMPSNQDLKNQPKVLSELIRIIRGLGAD